MGQRFHRGFSRLPLRNFIFQAALFRCFDARPQSFQFPLTTREHEPDLITKLFARKVVTMGFTGTYTDESAEFEATALVGKRSARLHVTFRLLVAD